MAGDDVGRVKIMCADDDEDIRTITELSLRLDPRIDVLCVPDGKSLLKELDADGIPDVILLDSLMPDLPGVEVAREIRQRPQLTNVPIIFLTAEADTARHGKFYESGASAVISKPFDPVTLVGEIERILQAEKSSKPSRES
jgi:CheY-like chemotaxis protein